MTENPTPAQLTGVRLDDLIASIRTVNEDPLDQLTTAMTAAAVTAAVVEKDVGIGVDAANMSPDDGVASANNKGSVDGASAPSTDAEAGVAAASSG